jgi:hypothetical protein
MGGPDASLYSHGIVLRLLCRPMSLVLPMFDAADLPSGIVCLGGFWHVLPVPSCIAVCLYGRCTGLEWPKRKGVIGGRVSVGAVPSCPFGKSCSVYALTLSRDGGKCCGCTCPSDFWVTSDDYQASWGSARTWMSIPCVELDQF